MSELAVVHQMSLIPIEPDLPLDKAAFVGCAVMTGVGAVINTARVEPGSSVAVFGCGGVGLNVVQGAWLAGADRIIAIDRLPNKLAQATLGSYYGSSRPRHDMPRLLGLYRNGRLMLDELVTRTYPIEEAWSAFEALEAGENVRGLIRFMG
ncbi:MAG: hypothetical protein HY725_11590 [Candidatus Rokubacteria bacterium]|nr:hypothetical protein [Candidatus Rokubacteria bacterium]